MNFQVGLKFKHTSCRFPPGKFILTNSLAAVVHEHVTPKVHHETTELITRDIHTHDIFHRIQPVIDREVLPTKHYVPHPTEPGVLLEIPESQVPGRHMKWQLVEVESTGSSSDSLPVPATKHMAHMADEPVRTSSRKTTSKEGVPMTESVWRHQPTLETGAYESGQTIPLKMNCVDETTQEDSRGDGTPQSNVSEEDLLFREGGYGFGGMLPGLQERSPLVLPGSSRTPNVTGPILKSTSSQQNPRTVPPSTYVPFKTGSGALKKATVMPGSFPGAGAEIENAADVNKALRRKRELQDLAQKMSYLDVQD